VLSCAAAKPSAVQLSPALGMASLQSRHHERIGSGAEEWGSKGARSRNKLN
jgi:hypothetical protein